MPSFSLADEPWIPVIDQADGTGRSREAGIREALARAHDLILAPTRDEHPVLLRILLAVYDAAAGPANWDEWAAEWQAPEFNRNRTGAYLDQWAGRLDLYDARRPAFQAGSITEFPRQHTTLHHEYLGGTAAEFLNYKLLNSPNPVPPARAARELLMRIAFDVAGIKRGIEGGRTYGSQLGHLGSVTSMCVRGATLKDEILLNLPPRPRAAGDRPVWEADDPPLTPGAERPVTGRLDAWTWPSRIMRLGPDENGGITAIAWHDGFRPEGGSWAAARAHDPMTAWKPDGRRLMPPEHGSLPPWFGGLAADGGCAAVENARAAAARGILPPEYQLRVMVGWAAYNTHKTTIQNSTAYVVPLAAASVLASAEASKVLAAAANYPLNVPSAIQAVVKCHDGCTVTGSLFLDDPGLSHSWDDFREELEAGNIGKAVHGWRGSVYRAAMDLFDHRVAARSLGCKEEARIHLGRYLATVSKDLYEILVQEDANGSS